MSQPDARDPWWVPAPLEGPPAPQRAALCIAPDGMPVQPEVAAALRDAAKRLQAAGWEVEELPNLPPLQESADIQLLLWLAESRRAGTAAYVKGAFTGADRNKKVSSRRPKAARCFSTRSATWRRRSSSNFCVFSKPANTTGLANRRRR